MYCHPAFRIDAEEALPILRERAFGLFVVPTREAPFGVHVPFLADLGADGRLRIEFHVARVNPIHAHVADGAPALLACQGPDAYISPDWYGVDDQVPTWTYVAVHVKGTARLMARDETLDHVDRLSAWFEQRLFPKPPWTSAKMTARKRAAMLSAIVPIRLEADSVDAQKKLIQHKGQTEHEGAIAGLRSGGDADAHAIAGLMEESAEAKFHRR